jgi:hypothetical protein
MNYYIVFVSSKLHEAFSKYKACLLPLRAVVGASKHVTCANVKIITVWVSGNNKNTGLGLGIDVYARAWGPWGS